MDTLSPLIHALSRVFEHPLTWLIVTISTLCYAYLLFTSLLVLKAPSVNLRVVKIILTTLPLLGLLGTIMGIQRSFVGMQQPSANSEVVTSGIRDALFTTYVGLAFAVLGWVLLGAVTAKLQRDQHGGTHVVNG